MPMPPYPVRCYAPECSELAIYKIASYWSDSQTRELKTYALSCAKCLAPLLAQARLKQQQCRLIPGETLDEPGVFELRTGSRDRDRVRRNDLETQS